MSSRSFEIKPEQFREMGLGHAKRQARNARSRIRPSLYHTPANAQPPWPRVRGRAYGGAEMPPVLILAAKATGKTNRPG